MGGSQVKKEVCQGNWAAPSAACGGAGGGSLGLLPLPADPSVLFTDFRCLLLSTCQRVSEAVSRPGGPGGRPLGRRHQALLPVCPRVRHFNILGISFLLCKTGYGYNLPPRVALPIGEISEPSASGSYYLPAQSWDVGPLSAHFTDEEKGGSGH